MKAYVLVRVRAGEVPYAISQFRKMEGVIEADMTFGPYDAVVILEGQDVTHLGQIIANGIQPVPGVLETLTCLAVGA